MSFYNINMLADSTDPLPADSWATIGGCLTAPNNQETLKKAITLAKIFLNYSYRKADKDTLKDYYLYFKIEFSNNKREANIVLVFKHKTKVDHPEIQISGLKLATVFTNCGALHISNLRNNFQGQPEGTYFCYLLLKEVLKFATKAGYTFIFGNTAGYQNDIALPFFKRNGFIELIKYKNKRSSNLNIWIYKMLTEKDAK